MCTVTFVPTANGFVFTSNRDEDPKRAATQIVEERRGDLLVSFPQDAEAKGTWIAFSDKDQFACILNGAFVPHQRKENYSMSRGAMALAYFDYASIDAFMDAFNFEGMEPFTLLLYNAGDFCDLKWDETDLHVRKLSTNDIHLWSSSTLYSQEWWLDRTLRFKEFVARQRPDQKEIMHFHANELPFVPEALQALIGSVKPLTNIPVETTSVTSIAKHKRGYDFHFQRTDGKLTTHKSTY